MKLKLLISCVFVGLFTASCEDFIQVKLTESQVTKAEVFDNDITAEAAVTGIYFNMINMGGFASGAFGSITALAGLSADELYNYPDQVDYLAFEENSLLPENINVFRLWQSAYKTIYEANAVLEGLSGSAGVTLKMKDRLKGEAHFIRAFTHFYLVNLFGNVPLITTTDYEKNALVRRTPVDEVYQAILDDLILAKTYLPEKFVTADRVRPNKFTATALLARVYLYLGDWENAAQQSSGVIINSDYALLPDLNSVFLKNSKEAIWQLPPVNPIYNTQEARYFVFTATPAYHVLRNELVTAFASDDKRLENWIGSKIVSGNNVYYPFKYKAYQQNAPVTEYSMILRLAEQYLIRAEARARQGRLTEAIADLDAIRSRAGLLRIATTNPGISPPDLILAIEKERRLELFSEWGHRWFDLKRTDRAVAVLGNLKSAFSNNDELYPLPQDEIKINGNLKPQNNGY